ncbi:hypothetical protein [Sodalis-like endosymbiont of Proechinophthirus fluctus]|uniref:hypothetical protein n=1 Tax=Sodalis-like endosymbiont of Proechinophthirus fluctus TaxID=1462730 RepID=UPI001FCBDF01|nr:hypothetical protein [Sodalis-like endosymbiont of Proechinophthirus fluctus]
MMRSSISSRSNCSASEINRLFGRDGKRLVLNANCKDKVSLSSSDIASDFMHRHATNLIALSYVLELDTARFTRELREGSTEYLVVFSSGIGIIPWIVLSKTVFRAAVISEK